MPDIIITPSSGIIDFFPVATRVGRIEGSGNTINIINPSGFVAVSGSGLSINTSSPNATFHAYSATSGATLLNIEGTNGSLFSVVDNLSGTLMSVNNNAGLPVFEVFSDDRVVAGRFGQNDFIMTSGGNIGIGTGVPSSKFHVLGTSTFNGDVSSTGSFIAGSGSAGNPSFEFSGDTDTGMFTPSGNVISFATSGVERLRIDNIGRVGIGTTSPTSTLHVIGSGLFSNNVTASGFVRSGGTSSQFLKADGSVDSTTYQTNISDLNNLYVGFIDRPYVTSDDSLYQVLLSIDDSFSALYTDNTVVRTTGTQTIIGNKTFSHISNMLFTTEADGPLFEMYAEPSKRMVVYNTLQLKTSVAGDSSPAAFEVGLDSEFLDDGYGGFIENIIGVVTTGIWRGRAIEVNKGGTGRLSYSNGQLLIGSGTSLAANTLTAGTGIGITNGAGAITIGVTGIPSSSITNFNSGVSGLLPNIANSGNNRILTSDGSNIGINANSNLYFSGNNKNVLNLTSITGVSNRPTLTIGGEGLSNLSGTPSASFLTNGRLIIAKSDQTFVDIDAQYNTFSINGSLDVDPYSAGTINCMFVNAGTALGGSLSTDTLNVYQISANNFPTTNIGLSDSVTISSYLGANISLYDSASISSNDGANITLTDNIGISSPGDLGLTYDSTSSFTIGDGSTILTLNNSNVGIGTATPSTKLHIVGDVLATGSFIAGSGTAALPSFEFTGDPDTGLFSPAANTLGISTSGTERLRVNNIGNIGIGTSSPNGRLHVLGTGLVDGRLSVSPTTAVTSPLSVLHVSGSVTNNASLMISGPLATRTYLGIGNSDTIPFLSSLNGDISTSTFGWGFFDRGTDGYLHIQRKGGSSSWSSVMTMDRTNGNVGIGTGVQATTPPEKLTVDGTIRLADTAGNRLQFYRGGGTVYDYTISKEGNHLAISTASDGTTFRYTQFGYHASNGTWNPKTVINGFNGNVGIGTTSPNAAARLTIVGSGNTSASAGLSIVNSSSSNLLYVRDDGNIGMGTTTPSTRLQVSGLISQSANHAVAGLTADQTITAAADTVIQLTDKDDPNNWWNASTYRFLPTVSGNYFVSAQVNWKADTGTGQINSQLRKNGTTFCLVQNPQVSGVTLTQVLTGIVNLNGSTDYVELTGYSSATDGSQLVTGTSDQAWTKLEAYKIS